MTPLKIKPHTKRDKQLRFETLLIDISTLFISLPADQIDSKIEDAQQCICEFLDLDRIALWQFQEQDPDILLLTHYHQPADSRPPPSQMTASEYFPWVQQKIMKGKIISISKISDLPVEAAVDVESFRIFGAKSGVYVPLSVGERPVFGVLTFAAMREEREWPKEVVKGFKLLAQVFSNAIARKRSETALRESEANLLLTTNAAGAGLWNMDLDTRSVWVSEKIRELFHFDPDEEVSESSFFKMMHPEDRQYVMQIVQQAIQTKENFSCEYRIELPDGKIRWIASRGQLQPETGRGLDHLLGVSIDITEDKQAELRQEEQLRFETLLTDISARFVNLPAHRIDSVIEDSLHRIAELLELDIVTLWQSSSESPHVFRLTHSYSCQGDLKHLEITEEQLPWYKQQMLSGKIAGFSSLVDLPPEAAQDKEFCRQLGIKSNLCFPLSVGGGQSIGLIGFNTLQAERAWPEALVMRLQLVAQIFANALERVRMDIKLQTNLHEIEGLKQRLEHENLYLQEEVKILADHSEILGQSVAIKHVLAQAEQVARTDSTVLLLGKTGTGKELLARHIHRMSLRKDRPLVAINCAALPPFLIENELFGREQGAYTGALTKMIGRFELADGSTIFLDEIGELPLDLQNKLLRVLEEGQFERLGSTKTKKVNVRIIAATNRDLAQEVEDGRFRQDLFYRLNVFPIVVPSLSERSEDIPLLIRSFVRTFNQKMGKQVKTIPKDTMIVLQSYSWPGNVRELRNIIERAMIMSTGETLAVQLPAKASREPFAKRTLEDIMRREILAVLAETHWRVAGPNGAAEILGLKKTTLYSKMKKLGLSRSNP